MKKYFNKNFWHFLIGFTLIIIVSLFVVIFTGALGREAETENVSEDCVVFC